MTLGELQQKLRTMPEPPKEALLKSLGNLTEERCLEMYSSDPMWELKICRALGVPSYLERIGKATFDAAWFAKAAFWASVISIIVGVAIGVTSILLSLAR